MIFNTLKFNSLVKKMVYTIIIFYKFKELSPSQEGKARKEWDEIKSQLPEKIRFVSNNSHAFGTAWSGFLIVESEDFESYVQFWKWFKDRIRWYVAETQTIIGTKRE